METEVSEPQNDGVREISPKSGKGNDSNGLSHLISEHTVDNIDWCPDEKETTAKCVVYVDLEEMEDSKCDGESSGTEDSDSSSESSSEEMNHEPEANISSKPIATNESPKIADEDVDMENDLPSIKSDQHDGDVVIVSEEMRPILGDTPRNPLVIYSSSSSSEEEEEIPAREIKKISPKNKEPERRPPRTAGEILLDDLPAIESLSLEVNDNIEMRLLGKVSSIVDSQVIVQSAMGTPSLNTDSFLFKEDRSPIGQIFDTFGPVISPYYSIRFNSNQHALDSGIVLDMNVFYAPKEEFLSRYVFIEELKKEKGSDASWKHDNEPPPGLLEYSDDETEKRERRKLRDSRRQDGEEPNNSVEQSEPPKNRRKATARRSNQNRPSERNSSGGYDPSPQPIVVGDWRHQPPPPIAGNFSPRGYNWSLPHRPGHIRPPRPNWNSVSNRPWRPPNPTTTPDCSISPVLQNVPSLPDSSVSSQRNSDVPSAPNPAIALPHYSTGPPPHSPAAQSSNPDDNTQYNNLYDYYLNYYTNYYKTQNQQSAKSTNE